MALQLRVVNAAGEERIIEVVPGQNISVEAGETYTLVNSDLSRTVELVRDGDTLLIRTADGELRLDNFFDEPESGAVAPTLVFEDLGRIHVLSGTGGEETLGTFTVPVTEGLPPLPEDGLFPEDDLLISGAPGDSPVFSAFFLPPSGDGAEDGTAFSRTFPEGDDAAAVEIFAGLLAPPTFTIASASAVEAGNIVFTVTRSGQTKDSGSVDFTVTSGSAMDGSDFTAIAGTLDFDAGETAQSFTVTTLPDTIYEANESFNVTLSNPTGDGVIGAPGASLGTIIEDEAPPVFNISAGANATEGGALVFTITRDIGTVEPTQTVSLAAGGSASPGTDFVLPVASITFATGETSKNVTVTTSQDALFEPTEFVSLSITGVDFGGVVNTASASSNILDDDPVPSFAISSGSAVEGGAVLFTVTRTGDSAATQTVDFATTPGTAIAADFTAASGTLTFNQGEASKSFTVSTTQDVLAEGNETFSATLSNPTGGATLGTAVGTGTIIDDDIASFVSPAVSATEGDSIVFTITRTLDAAGVQTVDYSFSAGTAVVGDAAFGGVNGTLTFNPGVLSQTITVATNADAIFEADETFLLNLTNATGGAQIGTPTSVGTILNDEAAPSFSITGGSIAEGGVVTFTVTRTGVAQADQAVSYGTVSGSALAGDDFTTTNGSFTFTSADASGTAKTFTVQTTADNALEADETFSVNLSGATAGAVIGTGTATGTITNNDAVFSIADVSEAEGGGLLFTVTRSGNTDASQIVTVNTSDGTATTANSDYTAIVNQDLTFGIGVTTQSFTVSTTNDTTLEADETFSVALTTSDANASIDGVNGTATGTITNNDSVFSIADVSAAEGGGLLFTVTRTGNTDASQVVTVNTSDGTATTANTDYTAIVNQDLTFGIGVTTQSFTVSTTNDTTLEADETFSVALTTSDANASIDGTNGTATGTITNNDAVFSIADVSEAEGGGLLFTVTRSGNTDASQIVTVNTSDGTATTANSDYTAIVNQDLTFGIGVTTQSFTVSTTNDTTLEADETFSVALTTSDANASTTGTATGTITNNDSVFSLAGDVAALEGNDIVFTVNRTGDTSAAQTVRYETSIGGTAEPADFTATGGPQDLVFAIGETSKTITIQTNDDAIFELNETFTVSLSTLDANASIGTATATGTITNNELPPSFAIAAAQATEGGVIIFTVTRSFDSEDPQAVNFATANAGAGPGFAAVGVDYIANSGTLTFNPGVLSQSFSVTTVQDGLQEGNEVFSVSLNTPTGGSIIGTPSAQGTIIDDDIPTFNISPLTVTEGGTFTFVVTRTLDSTGVQTVDYATSNGAAILGTDFSAASGTGTLSFSQGVTSQSFTVATISPDNLFEGTETFSVTLSNALGGPTGANIGTGVVDGTITDLNTAPVFSIADTSITEGGLMSFTVSRTGDSQASQTVSYSTATDTAGAGDFTAASGSVTFNQGDGLTKTFTVQTTADNILESPDETFTATISATGSEVIGDGSAVGTIEDDDSVFSIADVSAAEGGGLLFTVTRTGDTTASQVVTVNTSDGTATTANSDYTAIVNQDLTFGIGVTTQSFTVSTTNDTTLEADETFSVALTTSDANASIDGVNGTATGTITNNDSVFSIADVSAAEGGGLLFTVTRTGDTTASQVVTVNTSDGTATTADTDYTAIVNQDLTFGIGVTTQSFTVSTTNDTTLEADETFSVALTTSDANASIDGTNGTATGTITNNDSIFSIADVSEAEGDGLVFTVTRTGNTDASQVVTVNTSDGTATTANSDYTAIVNQDLTFGIGVTTQSFTVSTTNDTTLEADETFSVALTTSDANASIDGVNGTATGTITNNDAVFSIAADVGATEGTGLVFTVNRTGDTSASQDVTINTSAGTATGGGTDYTNLVNQTLTFGVGETAKTFTVATNDDGFFDPAETFTVAITTADANATIGTGGATGTINDNETAPTFAIADSSIGEGGVMTFTVTRTGDAQASQSIDYVTAAGTATETANEDYTAAAGTLTFNQGDTAKTFTVQTTQDALAEGNENFAATISAGAGVNPGDLTDSNATGTIIDDDIPTFNISTTPVTEGGTFSFVVTRTLDSTGVQTVDYATSNGTATLGTDFAAASGTGTLTFNPGVLSQSFTVVSTDDALFEGSEAFTATLSNALGGPAGANIGTAIATATILDNDSAPSFAIASASAAEDGAGIIFTVTRTGDAQATQTVDFTTSIEAGDTAEIGDFTANSNTLTFAQGVSTQSFTVLTTTDTLFEDNETFTATLSNATGGATIGTAAAVGTVNNDEAIPSVSITPTSATEGSGVVFTVTRSGDAEPTQSVNFTTSIEAGDTAEVGDFTANSGTVTFNQGELSKTFTVQTTDDGILETDETFTVTLDTPVGVTIATPTVAGTINNDDGTPVFSITGASAAEDGTGIVFTVSRAGDAEAAQTVDVSTSIEVGDSAEVGDFTALAGQTLTFNQGVATQSFTVLTSTDTLFENDETFTVTLSNPQGGATLGTASAQGTIQNDDAATSFAISASSELEDGTGVVFTVTRTGDAEADQSVDFATSVVLGDTAELGDFTSAAGTLTFTQGGAATQSFTVLTTSDATFELDETFTVALSNPTNGAVITTATAKGTITNDEAAPVFSISDVSGEEGTGLTFTVSRTAVIVEDSQSINFATASGTAIQGTDFTANLGTLTFAPGENSKTFAVATTDNAVFEGDETFSVTLSGATGGATISGSNGNATGTIQDETDRPSFSISDASATEGGSVIFTVTRTGDAVADQSISFATSSGTAIEDLDEDYTGASGTLTFSQGGPATQTFTVQTTQDATAEGNETFAATLSGPTGGATIGTGNATGTIIDDDVPVYDISVVSVDEGNAIVFTVTRDILATVSQTVDYALSETGTGAGFATMSPAAGADFTFASGTLTFGTTDFTQTFTVTPTADSVFEGAETFLATISNPGGTPSGNIGTATATATIGDLQTAPEFSISAGGAANEGSAITFTVTLSGAAQAVQTVQYQSADGSATTAGLDYTASGLQTLTFNPGGALSQTFTVSTSADSLFEGAETFTAGLVNPTGGATINGGASSATGTINDLTARPTFSIADSNITEAGVMSFTVTRAGDAQADQTLDYAFATNTAGAGDFNNALTGSVTFSQGDTTQTFTVQTTADSILESPDETFTATISASTGVVAGDITDGSAVGTINDDDSVFSIAAGAPVTEGGAVTFTVTRSGDTSASQTVNYATSIGGTEAAESGDFTGSGGSQPLVFGIGETSKTFTVQTTQDSLFELDENFVLTLTTAEPNASIGTAAAEGTINNDEAAPSFSIAGASAIEGDSTGGIMTFFVTRTGDAEMQQTVNYATTNGTALLGTDFSAASGTGTLTFNQGVSVQSFTVQAIPDATAEGDKSFTVNLSGQTGGAVIGGSSATGTVTDDDIPVYTISAASATEGSGVSFTVTRDISGVAQTVDFDTSATGTGAGFAIAGTDYTAIVGGTLSFGSGDLSQTITVTTATDSLFEGTETFLATISNVTGASGGTIGTATAIGTILDADTAPVFSIADSSITEGGLMSFTVSRTGDSQASQTVSYSTTTGTAGAGDFTATSGSITFNQGDPLFKTFAVQTTADNILESPDETFTATISATGSEVIGDGSAVGTINDDDSVFSIADVSAAEGGGLLFTVTRTGDITASQVVTVNTSDGTATTANSDYTAIVNQDLTFGIGVTTQSFTVSTTNDTALEADETFSVALTTSDANASIDPVNGTATGTITNNDAVFSIADVSAAEGGGLLFTVTRTGNTAASQDVTVNTSDGTATTADTDYTAIVNQVLTFGVGITTQSFTVSTTNDTALEADETFSVALTTSDANASIDPVNGTATGTITNNDSVFSIADVSQAEGGGLLFTVTRTGNTDASQVVTVNTSDGTATTADTDYTAIVNQDLTFGIGVTTQSFTVSTTNDNVVEADETFSVALTTSDANASIDGVNGTATITNNDSVFSIAGDVGATEGTGLVFTVNRGGNTSASQDITINTTAGTATGGGTDYSNLVNQVLTFGVGESSKTFTVATTDDGFFDPGETFTIAITTADANATIGTGGATGTINDNETAPTFAIADSSIGEGGVMTFTVTRTGDAQASQSIDFVTAAGTATETADEDYMAAAGTLTFNQGDTTQTFTVQTTQDGVTEGNETFTAAISAGGSEVITDGSAVGTIIDDDIPTFSITDSSALEDGSGIVFTVTRSLDAPGIQTVDYQSSDGAAVAGQDYTATGLQTLSFSAGQLSKTFTVATTTDSVFEADEAFAITLSNPTNGSVIGTGSAQGTITNDDPATSFAVGVASVAEGGLMTFTVIRTGDAQATQTVNFATSIEAGDTAEVADFTTNSGTLTFNAGETTQTFTVQSTQDALFEPSETFTVTLSSPTGSATIGTAAAQGTITNDEASPSFAIADASATEGGAVTFTVTRTGDAEASQTVDFATASGTAIQGTDFTSSSGTLTFNAGQTTRTFTVATIDDGDVEADETFGVTLSNATGSAVIGTGSATGTIIDNDSAMSPTTSVVLANLDGSASGVTAGIKLNGVNGGGITGDKAGSSVAGIGDVNGDGRADLLIGARGLIGQAPTFEVGGGYVIFGDTTANLSILTNSTTGFDLGSVNGTNGMGVIAPAFNAGTGSSVSGGGDYNGDGVSDLLLGESHLAATESAYVVHGDGDPGDGGTFGGLDGIGVDELSGGDLNGDGIDDGSVITGAANTLEPLAVGDAGDVDNDGIDDFLVGQPGLDTKATDSGQAFLIYGSSGGHDGLDPLSADNGTAVLNFDGHSASQFVGRSVSGIGDINNDGFDDFIMGATASNFGKGKAYVVFGDDRATLGTLRDNIENLTGGFGSGLDSFNGSNGGFVLDMSSSLFSPQFGFSTSALGDFNGDGFDDFVVGGPGTGEAYVVYGKAGGFSNIDVANDLTGEGADVSFLVNGFMFGFQEQVGYAVSGAGDVNGDGYDDVIIGAKGASNAYIVFGTDDVAPLLSVPDILQGLPFPQIKMVDFGPDGGKLQSGGLLEGAGVRLDGVNLGATGKSVAALGDFNGDGFDDVAVGAPDVDPPTSINQPDAGSAGQVYVVYGQDFSNSGAPSVIATATSAGDALVSGLNSDDLGSGGNADVTLRSGAGNDVLRVNGAERSVDGGGGLDILTPDTSGINLDFDALTNKGIYENVEQVQLNGFGGNILSLDVRDVLDMSGVLNELLITGDAGVDEVRSVGQGWGAPATESRSVMIDDTGMVANLSFNVYSVSGASLLVQDDLVQTLIS